MARKPQPDTKLLMLGTRLVKEAVAGYDGPTHCSDPDDAAAIYKRVFGDDLDREVFAAIGLNTKNRVTAVWRVSEGSLNASIVHPRELFKAAVMFGCASIVICHNHPSGDPTPSGADIQLTRRIVKAGEILGIELLDHVVVGEEFVSLRERDLL